MKILLINGVFDFVANIEPIGLSYVASSLREAGNEVEVFEPSLDGLSVGKTLEQLKDRLNTYNIIGISIMSIAEAVDIKKIKNFVDNAIVLGFSGYIFAGGHGASIEYEKLLRCIPRIDSVVVGEGENTVIDLVKGISREDDLTDICGLASRVKGSIIYTPGRSKISDIDKIPFMARDTLKQRIEKYGNNVTAAMLSSRGCYANCAFCSVVPYVRLNDGPNYRLRSVQNIIDEIELLLNEHGVSRFFFFDEDFILPGESGIKRVKEMHDEIAKRKIKIKFHILTRIDTVTDEVIQLLKETGMTSIFLGIESFSNDDLDLYNKNIKGRDTETALQILFNHGYSINVDSEFRVRVGYIAFHPKTTLSNLAEGLAFFEKYEIPIKKFIRPLEMFYGTKLYNENNTAIDFEEGIKEYKMVNISGIDYSIKYEFEDKRIQYIYNSFIKYYETMHPLREKIRTIEKLMAGQYIEVSTSHKISDIRKKIDSSFYKVFNELVYSENHKEEMLNQIIEDNLDFSKSIIISSGVDDEILSLVNHFELSDKIWGMQWPTRC